MVEGMIGRKLGMTQVFLEDGTLVGVTVLEAGPCVVVQRRTADRDGYEAVQLGLVDPKAAKRVRRFKAHHDFMMEFTVDASKTEELAPTPDTDAPPAERRKMKQASPEERVRGFGEIDVGSFGVAGPKAASSRTEKYSATARLDVGSRSSTLATPRRR